MPYVLAAADVPEQERQYYAGPVRKIARRMAHKVTHSQDYATRFATIEDAEAMSTELGGGYEVVPVGDKA